jgi:uncharacterized membrane protein
MEKKITRKKAPPKKKFFTAKTTVIICAVLVFACCFAAFFIRGGKSSNKDVSNEVLKRIYVAGDYVSQGSRIDACYWAKGIVHLLPGGKSYSTANAITLFDGKVYVAGMYRDGNVQKACYWVDKKITTLPCERDFSTARAIAVADDGKVYIAGYFNSGDDWKACYWADGQMVELKGGVCAESIAVDGGKVYIAGLAADINTPIVREACYWIDGELYRLPGGNYASGIAVADGKVYVSGGWSDGIIDNKVTKSQSKGYYWVDGVKRELSGGRSTYDIAVANGKVYVSGLDYSKEACYWEDGKVKNTFPNGTSEEGYGIAAADGMACVVGNFSDAPRTANSIFLDGDPCFWLDRVKYQLPRGNGATAKAVAFDMRN